MIIILKISNIARLIKLHSVDNYQLCRLIKSLNKRMFLLHSDVVNSCERAPFPKINILNELQTHSKQFYTG